MTEMMVFSSWKRSLRLSGVKLTSYVSQGSMRFKITNGNLCLAVLIFKSVQRKQKKKERERGKNVDQTSGELSGTVVSVDEFLQGWKINRTIVDVKEHAITSTSRDDRTGRTMFGHETLNAKHSFLLCGPSACVLRSLFCVLREASGRSTALRRSCELRKVDER